MTDPLITNLAALLGEASAPPARQAALARALATALADARPSQRPDTDPDAARIAAYLDVALPEDEQDRLREALAADGETLAEIESAQALLAHVAAASQPHLPGRAAEAHSILAAAQPRQPQRPTWLQRLGLAPPGRAASFAAGFSAAPAEHSPQPRRRGLSSPRRLIPALAGLGVAAACAVLVVPGLIAPRHDGAPGPPDTVSAFAGRQGSGGDLRRAWSGLTAGIADHGRWSAIALSSADRRYGAATGAASEAAAGGEALTACRKAGGLGCEIGATVQNLCLSAAAASPEPPATVPGVDAEQAMKAALGACHDEICVTVKTICPPR